MAISVVGVIAGFLSGAGITRPLWEFLLLTAAAFAAALAAFSLSQPRYKFRLFSLLYRRPVARMPGGLPYHLHVYGATKNAPVLEIASARKIDAFYEGGFRALLGARNPIAVIASNPRDISDKVRLPVGMFNKGGSRTDCVVEPGIFGIPLPRYTFEREPAEGTQDTDHLLAVRDLIYLPHLARALTSSAAEGDEIDGQPFIWPEHCVDPAFLADHDLCIIGAGDTNYWHCALFEQVWRSFTEPMSSVPLAFDMREGGAAFYTSRTMSVRLAGSDHMSEFKGTRRFELDERRFPTAAIILACENPYARAIGKERWCVFVAGTRSLGTAGAVLALAAILDRIAADSSLDYFSLVETADRDVRAAVTALLCRTTEVEYAADGTEPRGRRALPVDRIDSDYRDSYVPTAVEYLDNTGALPVWRPLVQVGGSASSNREPLAVAAASS